MRHDQAYLLHNIKVSLRFKDQLMHLTIYIQTKNKRP